MPENPTTFPRLAKLLGRETTPKKEDNFQADYGYDYEEMFRLRDKVEIAFDIHITFKEIMHFHTVGALCDLIDEKLLSL